MHDIPLCLQYVIFSQKQTVQNNLIYSDKTFFLQSYCIEQGVSFNQ